MVSTVRSRPNHYEVLGVGPAASAEEIKRAFQRKMSLFGAHLMAEAPQISVAYETLRDPAKRRDYDRTIGLHVGPEPHAWGFTVAPPRWMPLIASTPHGTSPEASVQTVEPHVEIQPEPEPTLHPRASAIGASLHELANPVAPKPVEQPPHRDPGEDPSEPLIQHILDIGRMERERLYEPKERSFRWKRPALAAGGLLLGAGLIGGIAGFSIKDNAATAKAEPALSVALPEAKASAEAAPAPVPADSLTTPELPRAAAAPTRRRAPQPQRPTGSTTAWADDLARGLSAEGGAAPAVAGAAATDAQPSEVIQASLPISNQTIKQTIERIGYSCGDVASTAPAGSGSFKITCTSGQTYQAKPVRGRYHFRRLAGG